MCWGSVLPLIVNPHKSPLRIVCKAYSLGLETKVYWYPVPPAGTFQYDQVWNGIHALRFPFRSVSRLLLPCRLTSLHILEFFYPCGLLKERSKINISMVPTVIHWEELAVHYVVRLWVRWGLCMNLLLFRVLKWRDGIDDFIPIDEHNNWQVVVTKSRLLNKGAQNSFCNTPDDITHWDTEELAQT